MIQPFVLAILIFYLLNTSYGQTCCDVSVSSGDYLLTSCTCPNQMTVIVSGTVKSNEGQLVNLKAQEIFIRAGAIEFELDKITIDADQNITIISFSHLTIQCTTNCIIMSDDTVEIRAEQEAVLDSVNFGPITQLQIRSSAKIGFENCEFARTNNIDIISSTGDVLLSNGIAHTIDEFSVTAPKINVEGMESGEKSPIIEIMSLIATSGGIRFFSQMEIGELNLEGTSTTLVSGIEIPVDSKVGKFNNFNGVSESEDGIILRSFKNAMCTSSSPCQINGETHDDTPLTDRKSRAGVRIDISDDLSFVQITGSATATGNGVLVIQSGNLNNFDINGISTDGEFGVKFFANSKVPVLSGSVDGSGGLYGIYIETIFTHLSLSDSISFSGYSSNINDGAGVYISINDTLRYQASVVMIGTGRIGVEFLSTDVSSVEITELTIEGTSISSNAMEVSSGVLIDICNTCDVTSSIVDITGNSPFNNFGIIIQTKMFKFQGENSKFTFTSSNNVIYFGAEVIIDDAADRYSGLELVIDGQLQGTLDVSLPGVNSKLVLTQGGTVEKARINITSGEIYLHNGLTCSESSIVFMYDVNTTKGFFCGLLRTTLSTSSLILPPFFTYCETGSPLVLDSNFIFVNSIDKDLQEATIRVQNCDSITFSGSVSISIEDY